MGSGYIFVYRRSRRCGGARLAHWGRDSLIARYRDVPLGHVFRHLLRKTAWKPRNWDRLYGAGIVDAYALLNEPLPNSSDVVSPRETDEFNPFDAFF